MKYATIEDVSAGFRSLDSNEESKVKALITETGILVNAYNAKLSDKVKKVVVCRIVRRAIGNGNDGAPMGATHNWENKKVRFFDKDWRTFGIPQVGIEGLIPLCWKKKVMVERYE